MDIVFHDLQLAGLALLQVTNLTQNVDSHASDLLLVAFSDSIHFLDKALLLLVEEMPLIIGKLLFVQLALNFIGLVV